MPRVTHFEINADQPERAVKFYRDVFGWKITKWEGGQPYWLVDSKTDGEPGIDGGVMPRRGRETTINTVGVDSVDEYLTRVKDAGGKVVEAKTAIPGMGFFAYCSDSEGNTFGLFENDPNAK